MHRLDHHYGIVDHYRYGKDEGRERKEVEREAHEVDKEERTYERHRHRDERDKSGTEVLQEDINDYEHEDECLKQSLYQVFYRRIDKLRHVLQVNQLYARREVLLLLFHYCFCVLHNLCSVGTGSLGDHNHHRRAAVDRRYHSVGLLAGLYCRHVLDAHGVTLAVAGDDHIGKLFRRLQTALVAYGVLILVAARLAELTRSGLDVLLRQHRRDVGRHQAVVLHLDWVEPNTHSIVLIANSRTLTHAVHTLDGRHEVDIGIVVEELVIVSLISLERHKQHSGRLPFEHHHAGLRHLRREQRLGLRHTVLHVHLRHIGVSALLEVDGNLG